LAPTQNFASQAYGFETTMPAFLRSGKTAAAALVIALACALSACATTSKCGASGCEGDAGIKEQVEDVIHRNQAIQPWSITVQAINGVVYLYGTVDTGLQKNVLEEEAAKVPGVKRVVNSITVRGNVW
jgi:osmotically-inducible protein OsmY